jgi:hypothetical protein
MDATNVAELELLRAKVDGAAARLKRAQLDLTSILSLLRELPPALKTGVMRVVETAFQDLGQAEADVLEMANIVRARGAAGEVGAPRERCPHCSRPYPELAPHSSEEVTG